MNKQNPIKPTRIWLIRHGEPEISVRGRCYGSLEIGLSPEGRNQIKAVSSQFHSEPLAAIYTSPRLRCKQSAEILAGILGCQFDIVDALSEIDFGEFEGRTYEEIEARYPDLYRQWMEHPTETQFPGGESFKAMWTRVTEAASALRDRYPGQSVAFLTHGGVIRILLAEVLGIPWTHIFRIAQRYAAVNLISYGNGYAVVELLNLSVGQTTGGFQ